MDVSNSTGDSTGYRVLGSGGVPPRTWKLTAGQDVYEDKGKTFVKIGTLWHEVLGQGTLDPFTYVTVKPRKRIHAVVFHRNNKAFCVRDVTADSQTPAGTAQPVELLVSLTQNGKNGKTASTASVCRWKKA